MSHFIDWRIDNAREPYARFRCTADVGAHCRAWCAEGCEEFCSHQPRTAATWEDGTRVVVGHRWEDTGECRIVTWLENGGTPGELFMGDDETPVRSGEIEVEWDGDCYLWQYAEAQS